MHRRVAGHHEQVPLEAGGRVVAARRPPAHDLAVFVAGARVGAADRGRVAARIRLLPAVPVVGEAAIDLGALRMRGDPFRAVHGGGADRRAGHAGVNGDLCCGAHAGRLRRQRPPFAGSVLVEARHRERAPLQQAGIVAALDIAAFRDEAVEELAALVVAHIDHDMPVGGGDDLGVLMLEAAERGALLRHGLRVERVDLDDIARPVRLVRVLRDVEALVDRRPGIAPVLQADAVALHRVRHGIAGVRGGEIAVEIFLAGQIGAPGRPAVAAIVPGAERGRAGGVGRRLEQVVAARRAGDLHRRVGGDAPVEGRVDHRPPAAVLHRDLEDADAVAGLALAHVVGGLRQAGGAVAVDDPPVHIFVVDGEHGPAIDEEGGHAVIVVAEGAFLAGAGAARRMVERLAVGPERVAPGDDIAPGEARRHGHRVQPVGGDGLEAEAARADGLRRAERAQAEEGAGRAKRRRAAQEAAAGNHALEAGRLAAGVVQFVEFVEREFAGMVGHDAPPVPSPSAAATHQTRITARYRFNDNRMSRALAAPPRPL